MPADTVVSPEQALPRRQEAVVDADEPPPLLITCILITAHLSFGILEGYQRTAIAIATAIGAELVMGRLTYGGWPNPASAYITGISVGILVRSPSSGRTSCAV